MWKKPNYIEIDRNEVMKKVNARAWTVGQAMSYGALCDQGVGASGVIYLPEGIFAEAYVAAKNEITHICTFVVNGVKRFYNWVTGIFS